MDDAILQIAAWGKLAGIKDATEPADLTGLFQCFRPRGAGVDTVFEGLPFGDAVLSRLRRVYACTADGYDEADAYFIPRPRVRCAEFEARQLLKLHFTELSRIAERMGDRELLTVLSRTTPALVATHGELNRSSGAGDSPDGWIYDMVTDYLGNLHREASPLLLLRDALYSIANDIFLRAYLMWPLYERAMRGTDPFGPYFDLWSKGVSYSISGPDSCRFFLAGARTEPPRE